MKELILNWMLRIRGAFARAGIEPPGWALSFGRALHRRWRKQPLQAGDMLSVGALAEASGWRGGHAEFALLRKQLVQTDERVRQLALQLERMEVSLYLASLKKTD